MHTSGVTSENPLNLIRRCMVHRQDKVVDTMLQKKRVNEKKKEGRWLEGASAKCERNAISQPLGIINRNGYVREERRG